jgi:hypothetical protein
MTVFSFDVTVSSHDLLKRGITEARLPGSPHHHHRVVIAADNRDDAALAAAQMAACIPGVVVTGCYDRI